MAYVSAVVDPSIRDVEGVGRITLIARLHDVCDQLETARVYIVRLELESAKVAEENRVLRQLLIERTTP